MKKIKALSVRVSSELYKMLKDDYKGFIEYLKPVNQKITFSEYIRLVLITQLVKRKEKNNETN